MFLSIYDTTISRKRYREYQDCKWFKYYNQCNQSEISKRNNKNGVRKDIAMMNSASTSTNLPLFYGGSGVLATAEMINKLASYY
jgi:hypothetical protein